MLGFISTHDKVDYETHKTVFPCYHILPRVIYKNIRMCRKIHKISRDDIYQLKYINSSINDA